MALALLCFSCAVAIIRAATNSLPAMGRAARTFGRSGWAWQGENVSTTPEAEEGEMDGQPGLVDDPEEADEIGAAEDEMDGLPDLESDASEEEDEIGADVHGTDEVFGP